MTKLGTKPLNAAMKRHVSRTRSPKRLPSHLPQEFRAIRLYEAENYMLTCRINLHYVTRSQWGLGAMNQFI